MNIKLINRVTMSWARITIWRVTMSWAFPGSRCSEPFQLQLWCCHRGFPELLRQSNRMHVDDRAKMSGYLLKWWTRHTSSGNIQESWRSSWSVLFHHRRWDIYNLTSLLVLVHLVCFISYFCNDRAFWSDCSDIIFNDGISTIISLIANFFKQTDWT